MLQKLADLGLLGWNATGDLGGSTVYTSERGKMVVFPRSPPLNPPTPAQEACRDKFKLVAHWWRECPEEYRRDVQRLARCSSSYYTGYNIVVCVSLLGLAREWETLCQQTGIELECPPNLSGP